MKYTKLLLLQVTPVLGIFNEQGECIGEQEAPIYKVYPGNDVSKFMQELRKTLEIEIPE